MKGINFIFFAVGATFGAVASYIVSKNKFESEMDQQIEELRLMYDERVAKIESSRKALDEMNEKKAEMMRDLEKKVEEEQQANVATDYNSISKPKKKVAKPGESIKFITDVEAQHYTADDYELIGLSLYEDDILIDDETENIIQDYEDWIGVNGIDDIRKSADGDGVYILNEERKAIYDITVIDERFGDDDELVQIH